MHQEAKIPNSKESEMMVLGCMLTNNQYVNTASAELEEIDFYYSEHQTIFLILREMKNDNKPTDLHLVCEELKRKNKLKAVGGVAYIVTLAQYAGTSACFEEYIE